jgi:hypothetical protein
LGTLRAGVYVIIALCVMLLYSARVLRNSLARGLIFANIVIVVAVAVAVVVCKRG